jgi:hypothetical protein
MINELPKWRWDNKWPLLMSIVSLIFTCGFIWEQFQIVIQNQTDIKLEMHTFLNLHNAEIKAITILQTNERLAFSKLDLPYSEFSVSDESGEMK